VSSDFSIVPPGVVVSSGTSLVSPFGDIVLSSGSFVVSFVFSSPSHDTNAKRHTTKHKITVSNAVNLIFIAFLPFIKENDIALVISQFLVFVNSHDHRLSRWLAQPYKGMLLAGLKAHRNI